MLVLGVGVSLILGKNYWPGSFFIIFAIGHFFLFCNLFRISRRLELIWTAIFLLLAGGSTIGGFPSLLVTAAFSICVTIIVVAIELKKPSYHGVFWQQINPGLRAWWDSQLAPPELP